MDKLKEIIRKNLVINAFDNLHEKPAQASQEIKQYFKRLVQEEMLNEDEKLESLARICNKLRAEEGKE